MPNLASPSSCPRNGIARALALLPVAVASLAAQAGRLIYVAPGTLAGDNLGYAVAACGDVDHDGLADVLVGAPWADDAGGFDCGSARVLGRGGRVIWSFSGDAPEDHFGTSVAGCGDVDRDGHPDFIVGAPEADQNGPSSGRAKVLSGRTGQTLYIIDGDAPGDECGYAVGAGGDIDRDGHADFIVGFHLADRGTRRDYGLARVYSGRDGHVIYELGGLAEYDHFGAWVGEVGDVDADGWTDFMVGAPWADVGFLKSGTVTVFSGRDASVLHTFHGEGGGHELGTAFAKCGDVDLDGHADLFIAEPEHKRFGDDAGAVKLFSGRTGALLLVLYGSRPYEYFGLTIGAGDFDADGVPDLVIGAFLADTGAPDGGAVYVHSGATFARIFAAYGTAHSDQFGRGVDFAGDIDGDGIGDIVSGAPAVDAGGRFDAGALFAFCGAPAGPATYTLGAGCPTARPFGLAFGGSSRAGQTLQCQFSNGPTTVPVAWLVLSPRSHPPLDLTLAGMPGCSLYQPLDILLPVTLSGGTGALPLPMPQLGNACGLQLFAQGLGWEPGSNPLGVITSNGGRIVVAR